MTIQGTFNNYKNEKSYTLKIYKVGQDVTEEPITIEKDGVVDYDRTEDLIFFATDPVTISCDYSDTFNHVIIKTATVRLVSNFNLKDLVLASNNRDIRLTITEGQDTLFSGFVEPLSFNEPYANNWETIEITATDNLATSQYIEYPKLIPSALDQMDTFTNIISNIATYIGLTVEYDGLDEEIYSKLSSTKLSNSLWVGDSRDDWMMCNEVLEEVGKYWGIWFIEDNGKLRCFNWHNETRTPVKLMQANFTDTSTNLSNSDAYTQIKLTCDVENADTIVEFGDDIVSPYTHYVKYLEELVAEGDGSNALRLFTDLVKNNQTADENDRKHPTESYIYKNFCWIKESDLWDFGEYGYEQFLPGHNDHPTTQQFILNWLRNNPGRGAFVSFGRTDKMSIKDNSPINSIDLKDYLVISVMGQDSKEHESAMGAEFDSVAPICSFKGSSKIFTPSDSSTTNYLVISGHILLNKLYAQTGKIMHRRNERKHKSTFGEEYDKIYSSSNGNYQSLYLDSQHTFEQLENDFQSKYLNKNGVNEKYINQSVPKIGEDDWGCYYIHKFFDGDAGSETKSTNKCLYGDLKQSKYNETWKYEYSYVDGKGKKVDNTSKIPILVCSLKIGNKYCVERIDEGASGWGKFEWMAEEDVPTIDNKKWIYFTIGIDPKIDDFIIGKEYDIQNTIWYYDDIDGKGTAIPIRYSDNLAGEVEFKIIKPMLSYWQDTSQLKNIFVSAFWEYISSELYWPILEKVSSIMLSDFKIELTSNKGHILNNTENNDLVYVSDENDDYVEAHEDDISISTMITSKEAAEWETEMVQSVSHVVNYSVDPEINNTPFYGFEHDTGEVDEDNQPIIEYIKPEQIYVNDFYNEYSKARTIVDTQIVLDKNYVRQPDKYEFIYPQSFKLGTDGYTIIGYEAGLKYDTISISTKNMNITNE